jgi:hypothetical protein
MAASKKPGNGARKKATPKKPAARRTKSAPATRKAPAKAARKTAPKSAANARAKSAAGAEAEASELMPPPSNGAGTPGRAGKTARAAKAESTEPSLRRPRRAGFPRSFAVGSIVAGVVVVIVLIARSGDDNNKGIVANTIPTITTATPAAPPAAAKTPTVTAPAVKTPSAAAPATAQPTGRAAKCDPIVGSGSLNSGKTYPVTSSANGERLPAGCGEAHSVLLSALSGQATQVGGWSCETDTSGDPIAVCRSGGRTILARG